MVPRLLPSLLGLFLAGQTATGLPAATSNVQSAQLFQLVVRVTQQPTGAAKMNIDGWRIASRDFITNAREIVVTSASSPGSGDLIETFFANTSAVTTRRPRSTADIATPYAVQFDGLFAGPPAYVEMDISSSGANPGTHVFENVTGQPYFGGTPPNNYNSGKPGEGHFVVCYQNGQPDVYIFNDLAADPPTDCAFIRLLPQCAGNFTAGAATTPKNVVLSRCYVNAQTAPIPTVPS